MNQISDAGRAGDEANKIRQRPCQCHAVQSHCSARTRLSRLEAGYTTASYKTFSTAGPESYSLKLTDPPGPAR